MLSHGMYRIGVETGSWGWAEPDIRERVLAGFRIAFLPGTEDNLHHSPKGWCVFQASPVLMRIPSVGYQESPGKGNVQSQVGGSLSLLGGPFNLKQDPCPWLKVRQTASSCQITRNDKC